LNAALLATGPFGSALLAPGGATPPNVAGGAAPGSATTGALVPPSGLPAAALPFGVPPGAASPGFGAAAAATPFGAFGAAPQGAGAALTNAQQQLGSSAQALTYLPQQTLNGLQGTAQQAAAEAIGQAAAPVDEAAEEATHKVGERLQTFGDNAASRVKRLFTRKRDRDDDAPKQDTH
jgi:hypothetical protein